MSFKFELGQEVTDAVTGFKGFIVSRTEHLTQCSSYGVQPKFKAGDKKEYEFFDEPRLTATGKRVKLTAPAIKHGAESHPRTKRRTEPYRG